MADSTGRELTFGRALVGSLLLARASAATRPPTQHRPPAAGVGRRRPRQHRAGFAGKVPVNLNFTAGRDAMAAAIERCGITTILTSQTFLKKAGLDRIAGHGVPRRPAAGDVGRFEGARCSPRRDCCPRRSSNASSSRGSDADALATIIFSSGSTGVPKGVMLTHRNVLANIDAATELFKLTPDDVVLGVLPFFHSFGFTVTLWLPLVVGFGAVYHPNPMDAKTIGELAATLPRDDARSARRPSARPTSASASREQFAHAALRDRRRREAARADRRGVQGQVRRRAARRLRLHRDGAGRGGERARRRDAGEHQRGARVGSVGRPMPGVAAKVVDPETGEGPLVGKEGLLLVNGPNRMAGYLGEPERTSEALRDGWYVTGDIATIDEAGFIRITDRLSRFSKIAGEMVPHMKVEERAAVAARATARLRRHRGAGCRPRANGSSRFYTDPESRRRKSGSGSVATELPKLWMPEARGPSLRRGDPDARHRQGGSARRAPARIDAGRVNLTAR